MSFWEDLAVAYRPAAVSRRHQVPLRLFVILVICVTMAWRPGFGFLLSWTGAYLVAQAIELQALRSFLLSLRPASTVAFNLAADVLIALAFGWVAIPIWEVGTPVAAAAATLLLAGSILTALMGAEGCVGAFIASAVPHLTYLAILPLIGGSLSDPVTPYFMIGVILLVLVLSMVFMWSRSAMMAERSARLAAEAQTAAKSAFVAMVSHELRTPINALLNGASALEREAGHDDRGAASLIADAGAMMRTLLNDLLDYSKIEAGRMDVETVDYDLPTLLGDTAQFWRGEARGKGIKLEVKGQKSLPQWIRGDPMRVRQILNNLLSNAIKFTAEGGVTVTLSMGGPLGRDLLIEVVDTGRGLTDDQVERLFKAYDQLGAETARNFGGTGLGLSISRDLAKLMGGSLTAARDAGGGARFTLILPAPEGVAPQPLDLSSTGLQAIADAPLILVVDDHDINRRALRGMLEAFGARVETAEDAEVALAACNSRVFDAILMDVRMPGVDGLEATRRLRAEGLNQDTPVIAVTGAVDNDDREACLQAGMTGYVEKPVGATELYAALFGDAE